MFLDKSNILTPSVEKIDIVTEDKIQRNVNSTSSSSGWVTIGSIVGNSTDPYEAIGVAMTKLQSRCAQVDIFVHFSRNLYIIILSCIKE